MKFSEKVTESIHYVEPRETLLEDVPKMLNQFEKKNKIKFYGSKDKKTNIVTRRIYYGDDDKDQRKNMVYKMKYYNFSIYRLFEAARSECNGK